MDALCEAVKNDGPVAGRIRLALVCHPFWTVTGSGASGVNIRKGG